MSTTNDMLYEDALEAINALFSDRSVSVTECIKNLNELIGEIERLIDSLEGEDAA